MTNIIKPTGEKRVPVSDYHRERAPAFDDPVEVAALDPHEVLAAARADAERKVREAYEEGLKRGYAAGQQRFDEGVANAVDTLRGICEQMLKARIEFLDSLQPQLVRLATSLAGRVLHREVQLDPEVISATARAALERVLDAERVVLRVNPGDVAVLRERKAEYLAEFERIETLEIVGDASVESGGCVACTSQLEIDARLGEQLETMMTQMLSNLNVAKREMP